MSKFTLATPEFIASQIEYYSTDVEYHGKKRNSAYEMAQLIDTLPHNAQTDEAREQHKRDFQYHLEREQRAQMWLDILYSAQDYKAKQAY